MTLPQTAQANVGEDRFRSWGEVQIARMLRHHGLPFCYEQPTAIVEAGRTRIWYPDFQLCGQGVLLEYCGRPQDPVYAQGMARKQAAYAANGLTALMFTPDVFQQRWPMRVLDALEAIQTERLAALRAARQRIASGTKRAESPPPRPPYRE